MDIQEAIQNKYSQSKTNYSPVERSTLTVKEVAKYLGISFEFVYKLCREKQIPHIKIGSRIIFKKDSIDNWLDELEQHA